MGTLQVSSEDGVWRITFNRPEVHNAQNVEMLEALDAALSQVEQDPSARVVILAGAGRSFCSGHDLREISANPKYAANFATVEGRYQQEQRLFAGPVVRFRQLRVPTVCRVQGHCIAAGLMFAASADLVVAASDAKFRSPIIGSMGINDAEVPSLALRLGERRAKQMLWLDETLDASDALGAGLVNWIVEPGELDAKVEEVVARLCQAPPQTLALSKMGFQFMADRLGETDVARYHFMVHQLSHQTDESRQILVERVRRIQQGGSPIPEGQR